MYMQFTALSECECDKNWQHFSYPIINNYVRMLPKNKLSSFSHIILPLLLHITFRPTGFDQHKKGGEAG